MYIPKTTKAVEELGKDYEHNGIDDLKDNNTQEDDVDGKTLTLVVNPTSSKVVENKKNEEIHEFITLNPTVTTYLRLVDRVWIIMLMMI